MKKLYIVFAFLAIGFLSSCGSEEAKVKKVVANLPAVDETEVLHNFLDITGDFINNKRVPTMITAQALHAELSNPKYFVIDMRSQGLYEAGHIEGAVNVSQPEMYNFFTKKFNAGNYEKVVITCKSGQSASYVTSLLQLLGYKNVYALKRGMSAWNKAFSEKSWTKNAGSNFAGQLSTEPSPKGNKGEFPTIETGKRAGIDILEARVKEAFAKTPKDWGVKASAVFENPDKYYIINYWPAKKYMAGHIPGAIQYTPKQSLSFKTELATLPTDKPVLVYCYTGQHAAFVVAYLRTLGYDAYSLLYGANGFMNSKMNEGGTIGHAFAVSQLADFPTIEGPNPTDKPVQTVVEQKEETPDVPVVKKKKAVVEEEGGC